MMKAKHYEEGKKKEQVVSCLTDKEDLTKCEQ